MLLIAIALQAAAPAQTDMQPAAEPAPTTQVADTAPDEPKMKRVCRKVMDPRTPTVAARQTVCKYVPADEGKQAQR